MARRHKRRLNPRTPRWRMVGLRLHHLKLPSQAAIRTSAIVLAWLLWAGGLVAAWGYGVPSLQAFSSERNIPSAIEVRFVNPPSWFRGELAETLTRSVLLQLTGDPLRQTDLVTTRNVLLESGWFESVDQVRRNQRNAVEIHARFVSPCAVVRDREGDHLIDARGALLPKSYTAGEKTPFVAITGGQFPRPARPGRSWEGADIAAAVELLRLIRQQAWRDQVLEIDVSGYLDEEVIRLVTDRGTSILWGNVPGGESALEVFAHAKIARLNYLYEHHKRIDGGLDGELDITGDKAVIKR